MAYNSEIHSFAVRWLEKYRNPDTPAQEVEEEFSAECNALGFEMDCGKSFEEAFPETDAFSDADALAGIIGEVFDLYFLGSVVFSKWQCITHSGASLLDRHKRNWFIVALSRLELLAACDELSFVFHGQARKIHIVSRKLSLPPRDDDEVEQHLTITADGGLWFSVYNYQWGERGACGRRGTPYISKEAAANIVNAVGAYFSDEDRDTVIVSDVGSWQLFITDNEGKISRLGGSLRDRCIVGGVDLSDLIRDTLGMQDLLLFDGNIKPDRIERITVVYRRVPRVKPEAVKNHTEDYSEQLVLDRGKETLEYTRNVGPGCVIANKYYVRDGISSLLDDIYQYSLFECIAGNGPEVVVPNEIKEYEITVDFQWRPQLVIRGEYDWNGLPEDWPAFAAEIRYFIDSYGLGEILDPSIYLKVRRRVGDYIFCSVEFYEGDKTYYYLTDDDTLVVGDSVYVPVGKDGRKAVVEIVDIEYFSEEEVPYPLDKVKRIIGKCSGQDCQESDKTVSEDE